MKKMIFHSSSQVIDERIFLHAAKNGTLSAGTNLESKMVV